VSRIATERVYSTADGRYCAEDDPAVAFLVCGVGGVLPDDYEPPAPEKVEIDHVPKAEGESTPKRTKKG
jgi:hypothetical protein